MVLLNRRFARCRARGFGGMVQTSASHPDFAGPARADSRRRFERARGCAEDRRGDAVKSISLVLLYGLLAARPLATHTPPAPSLSSTMASDRLLLGRHSISYYPVLSDPPSGSRRRSTAMATERRSPVAESATRFAFRTTGIESGFTGGKCHEE